MISENTLRNKIFLLKKILWSKMSHFRYGWQVLALVVVFVWWPVIVHPPISHYVFSADSKTENSIPPVSLAPLELTSLSAVVLELPSGQTVATLEPDLELPLASLTKLMTALVAIDYHSPLQNKFTMTAPVNSRLLKNFQQNGDTISYLKVKDGEVVKIYDLLSAGLIGSANNAMAALATTIGYNTADFVTLMNQKAHELDLVNTVFADPTGLLPDNMGTAYDVAKLAQTVWRNPTLQKLSGTPLVQFKTSSGQLHTIKNTNRTVIKSSPRYTLVASKTGYLHEAGDNIVFQVKFKNNREYIVSLLNAPEASSRVEDVVKILDWLEKRP